MRRRYFCFCIKTTKTESLKRAFTGRKKRKLIFMKLHPSLSKEKIQGTYFEICQTYFELCPTYFSPLENPCENRAKNADKFRSVVLYCT